MSESDNVRKYALACMRLAAECRDLAADVPEPELRAHFLHMASMWTELEHFSIRLGVARVCEISFAFVFGNLFEKRGDCSPKLLNSARLHFA